MKYKVSIFSVSQSLYKLFFGNRVLTAMSWYRCLLGVLQLVSVLDSVGLILGPPMCRLAIEFGDKALQFLLAFLLLLQLLLYHLTFLPHRAQAAAQRLLTLSTQEGQRRSLSGTANTWILDFPDFHTEIKTQTLTLTSSSRIFFSSSSWDCNTVLDRPSWQALLSASSICRAISALSADRTHKNADYGNTVAYIGIILSLLPTL